MNIKERIQTVLQKLKLLDKAKANQLTDEEWKQIVDSYKKEYQSTLQEDLAADMAAQAAARRRDRARTSCRRCHSDNAGANEPGARYSG